MTLVTIEFIPFDKQGIAKLYPLAAMSTVFVCDTYSESIHEHSKNDCVYYYGMYAYLSHVRVTKCVLSANVLVWQLG